MFAQHIQNPSQVDYGLSIHLPCFDRRSACGRQPDDEREICAPREMIAPMLSSRVIQRNNLTRYRVARLHLGVFVIVASLTRQCEIFERGFTALAARNDMFNSERLDPKAGLTATILTTALRPLCNCSSLLGSDTLISHRQARESPSFPSIS